MKPPKMALSTLFACAMGVLGQHYPDLTAWMKSVDSASAALTKLDRKTGERAVREAERIGAAYENMIGFWRQRQAPDAVKWSAQGKAAAAELANAANAGDAERAAAAFDVISETCRSCHGAHRERLADGGFRIK